MTRDALVLVGVLAAGSPAAPQAADAGASCAELAAAAQERGKADPGLWVSHAECLRKAGAKKAAREAAVRGIGFGSKETRLDAYAVLGRLGLELWNGKHPGPNDCFSIAPMDPSCLQPTWACGFSVPNNETGGGAKASSGVAFCPSQKRAAEGDWTEKNRVLGPAEPACGVVEFSSEAEPPCKPQEAYGHDLLDGGTCHDAINSVACEIAVAQCKQDPKNQRPHRCVFVYADACHMRVGAICDDRPAEFPAPPASADRPAPGDPGAVKK